MNTGQVMSILTQPLSFHCTPFPADSEATWLWPARQCGECVCAIISESVVTNEGLFGGYSKYYKSSLVHKETVCIDVSGACTPIYCNILLTLYISVTDSYS